MHCLYFLACERLRHSHTLQPTSCNICYILRLTMDHCLGPLQHYKRSLTTWKMYVLHNFCHLK